MIGPLRSFRLSFDFWVLLLSSLFHHLILAGIDPLTPVTGLDIPPTHQICTNQSSGFAALALFGSFSSDSPFAINKTSQGASFISFL
ncbi:hypothetical protein BCR34DRAFT_139119 [Clohesyomyces aquaticus]|uniref:Secreted protein n=1 Tax=Clohesyomyces aquaticus TaxID=1231657 RepID=A0A1Y2A1J3_9PLEO|nr:hypothetical protein BCR34DRAFT_139119 [Clohesyomyces aquaticus]